MPNYTWIPIHRETVEKLLKFRHRQTELLEILSEMREEGLKVIGLNDQDPKGKQVPLTEIDPFTFLSSFNRGITDENRKANWEFLKARWTLLSDVPTDFSGIPVANNMKSWWFPYKYLRSEDHVELLWDLAEEAYLGDPAKIDPTLFNNCLALRGVAKAYVTMGMFWVSPESFLALDGVNRDYLEESGLDEDVTDYASYLALLSEFNEEVGIPYPEFSLRAWKWATEDIEVDPDPVGVHPVPEGGQRWVVAPGEKARYWPDCLEEGIITVGWEDIGDLARFGDREEIREAMTEVYGDTTNHGNGSLALWDFSHSIQVGDVVYAKQGMTRVLGWGVVTSGYRYERERGAHANVLEVDWKDTREVTLPPPCRIPLKTLTNVDGHPRFLQFVDSFYNDGVAVLPKPEPIDIVEPYSRQKALEDLFITEEKFDRILALLKRKKNIILQGPPGVGKTFIARRLAYALMEQKDETRAPMVQFHQSYAYEDFVQGYRPDGNKGFALKNGTFHTLCQQALKDGDRNYFLVIDEINRGNLSKIFGELMMLLEADKRGADFSLQLTYSETADDTFYIPEKLHLIGTMNTADRSLAMVDYALRRRFAFINLEPEFNSAKFREHLTSRSVDTLLIDRIIARMNSLNAVINEDARNLGMDYCIGHSFFCPAEGVVPDENWYLDVIQYEIAPLLYEYWVDDISKADAELNKLRS